MPVLLPYAFEIAVLAISAASVAFQQVKAAQARKRARREADARKGFEIVVEAASEPMPIVYGKAKVGGVRVFHNLRSEFTFVAPNSDKTFITGEGANPNQTINGFSAFDIAGNPISRNVVIPGIASSKLDHTIPAGKKARNEYLYFQQAICRGRIHALHDVLIDDSRTLADPTLGGFTSDQLDQNGVTTAIRIDGHYGTSDPAGGSACAIMSANFPERATSKFAGLAYVSVVVKLDRDSPEFQAVPKLQFLLEGRLVRKSVAGVLQPAAYSNNPAWCLLDYLLDADIGKGVPLAEIDLPSFEATAALCDTVVRTNAPVGGHLYQPVDGSRSVSVRDVPLYECNIAIDTSKPIRDNVEDILDTMGDARLLWSQGKYKLAFQYPTPDNTGITLAATFTDADLVLGQTIDMQWPSTDERLNSATVRYHNESSQFSEETVTWPPKRNGVTRRGVGGIMYPVVDAKNWDGNKDYNKLLNSYGVWDGTADAASLTWAFVAPVTGNYTIRAVADDTVKFFIDAETTPRVDYAYKTPEGTAVVALVANQQYTFRLDITNTPGNVKGVGAVLVAPDGSFSWTTRSPAYSSFDIVTVTDTVYQTLLAEDGGIELEVDTFEAGITDYYHALAKAEQTVRTSRSAMAVKFEYNVVDVYLEPGDIIKIESNALRVGISSDFFVKVDEVRMGEGQIAEVEGLRFDYTQLAWNVADDDYIRPANLYPARLPRPEFITYSAPTTILNNSSGTLDWGIVSDPRVISYILFVHNFDDLDADNQPIWRELGRQNAPTFTLPLLEFPSALFGIRSLSSFGWTSAMTVSSRTAAEALSFNPNTSRLVDITAAPGFAFVKDGAGVFTPTSITLTAGNGGFQTPAYKWFKDGIIVPGETTADLVVAAFEPTANITYRAEVREAGWPDDFFEARDSITIFSVAEGSEVLSMGFNPANVVFPADATGAIDPALLAAFSAETIVARGSTILTTGVVYTRLDTGVTSAVDVNTGVITISDVTAPFANIVVTATVGLEVIVKTFLVSKAIAGVAGVVKYADAAAGNFFFRTGGDVNDVPAPTSITITDASPGYVAPVRQWFIDEVLQAETGTTLVVPSFPVGTAPKAIRLHVEESDTSSPSNDTVTLHSIADGGDAYSAWFDDQAVNIPINSAGAIKAGFIPHLNPLNVYKGGVDVTSTASIAYVLESSTGVTATVNATTGAVTTDVMSADSGQVTVRATDPTGFTGLIKFTLHKTLDGVDTSSRVARIVAENLGFITPAGVGTVPAPASLTFTDGSPGYLSPVRQWYVDDVPQPGETAASFVFPSFEATGATHAIRLDITETGGGSPGTDTLTVFSIRDGSDGYSVTFTDALMVLAVDGAGVVTPGQLPRNNAIIVFRGAEDVTSTIGIVYAIDSASAGITASINPGTGVVTVSGSTAPGTIQVSGTTTDGAVGLAQFQITHQSNAGNVAAAETVAFRQLGPPTNLPVLGALGVVASGVGTVDITFNWTYTPGAIEAQGFRIYAVEGTTAPTAASSVIAEVGADITSFTLVGAPADKTYRAGMLAGRVSAAGLEVTAIVTGWERNGGTPAIAGTVTIDGTTGSTVVSNADAGNTAALDTLLFRVPGAPTNLPVLNGFSASPSGVGSVDLTFNWTYVQGGIKAEGFRLYYEQGTAPVTTNSPILASVPGGDSTSYSIPGVPADKDYRVGIVAGRISAAGEHITTIVQPWIRTGATPDLTSVTLDSTPIATVVNAATETVDFRDLGVPSNQPVIGALLETSSAVGTVDLTLNWAYTQGALEADFFVIYFEDGTTLPTAASPIAGTAGGDARSLRLNGLPMDKSYKAGIIAARNTSAGVKGGAIVTAWTRTGVEANVTAKIDGTLPGQLKNANVSINANGALVGAGGGTVTIAGLGYTGHLNATSNTGAFANLSGTITAANAATYFSANSLSGTYIQNLAADKILAGTLAAGVVYAGNISANNITAGTMNAVTLNACSITGASNISGGANLDITGTGEFNGSSNPSGVGAAAVCANVSAGAGIGVLGRAGTSGTMAGVYGYSLGAGAGVTARNNSFGPALTVLGRMLITSSTLVANLYAARAATADNATNSNSLGGVAATNWARTFPCNTGTANAFGAGISITASASTGVRSNGSSNIVNFELIPSDRRSKKDIATEALGLDFIQKVRPVSYRLIDDPELRFHGVIYQEILELIPGNKDSLAHLRADGKGVVSYQTMIGPLIKAIQELSAEVNELKAVVKELQG